MKGLRGKRMIEAVLNEPDQNNLKNSNYDIVLAHKEPMVNRRGSENTIQDKPKDIHYPSNSKAHIDFSSKSSNGTGLLEQKVCSELNVQNSNEKAKDANGNAGELTYTELQNVSLNTVTELKESVIHDQCGMRGSTVYNPDDDGLAALQNASQNIQILKLNDNAIQVLHNMIEHTVHKEDYVGPAELQDKTQGSKDQDIEEEQIEQNVVINQNETDEQAGCQYEKSRKRKRNSQAWKRNSQKILRMAGHEYKTRSGKTVQAKVVKEVNCKCHYKCSTKVDSQDRQQNLQDFLSLDTERARWAFITKNVNQIPVKRHYQGNSNRRNHTLQYFMTCKEQQYQVCKQFFLGTYNISEKKVQTALSKLTTTGVTEIDQRGHKEPANKKCEDVRNIIRDHIRSLPVVDSHYCRSSSKRKYLPSGLSENRLYLDYVEYCKERNVEPEKASFYKCIFTAEFNIGFHRPKKDQCDYCSQHKNKSEEEKKRDEAEYDLHILRKEEARMCKKKDKEQSLNEPSIECFTMDMEKILMTPSLQIGQLYYTKKLKTYNFTVYNQATGQAINYMWHEGSGTKGASEVATCIWNLLSSLGIKNEVTFYSDTASGQNRNSVISAMFLRAVEQLDIQIINQKFMESGHSEMECDSVHSTIESRGRQVDVYTPECWYTVARTAKITKPFHKVVEMDYTQFLDFKKLSCTVITNKTGADNGEKLKWLKVKWFQYRKSEPTSIFFKYRLTEVEFQTLNIQRRRRRVNQPAEVSKLYSENPKVERGKLTDLLKLCEKGSIPPTYHGFYKNLEANDRNTRSGSESDEDD